MALNPEDPFGGFQHAEVVAFINRKIRGHVKGPEFYLENMSLPWEEVEDKLRGILEDSDVPSDAKEACAWGSLALGIGFACRQSQLQGRKVQWLQDFAKLHRSKAQSLAADLRELTVQQELERKEAAFHLQLLQNSLAEQNQLKWKLLLSEMQHITESATDAEAGTEGKVKEKEVKKVAVDTAGPTPTITTAAAAATSPATNAATSPATNETQIQLFEAREETKNTSERKREGKLRSVDTSTLYISGGVRSKPTLSLVPITAQPPASFAYSLTSLPRLPIPLPPIVAPPQMAPFWPEAGTRGINPQEPHRGRRDFGFHHQRGPRPGDWQCPWCKAMNFAWRDICFRCGRGIWLQNFH
ncbi:PREDICTED: testis-expressed sequence 13A protein-like [Chrysochloris asiatica]|uniref:Testis-expressed sequence 13A protein-like n=1 Tax=Chrysochloris asiatica TaxID=185453 RepID=A0A9B0WX28_CHRAS|nr:PREDICTED: testis-expressed sequence 13A protein-like [Chrysochloris asiatica]